MLNEGIIWRFTVPDADLNKLSGCAPAVGEFLFIKFELLHTPFHISPEMTKTVDYVESIIEIMPRDVGNGVPVASQTLVIQRATSGIHQYFPVRTKF